MYAFAQLSLSVLSHTLTRFKSCFGCATKWSVQIMSSTESSSQTDTDTSTQSSAASSRASTPPQRRRRARSQESTASTAASHRGGKTRKLRKLERKIGKLEEKLDVPADTKFKYNSNKDQYNLNNRVLADLRAAKKYTKSRRA